MPRFRLLVVGAITLFACARADEQPLPEQTASTATITSVADTSGVVHGTDWALLDSAAPNPFPPPFAGWIARADGVGEVRVGISADEATKRYGTSFLPPSDSESCAYIELSGAPKDVDVMIESGQLVRIDVRNTRVATDRGVRIGDSEADVRRAYAELVQQTPHPYAGPEWHYLTVRQPNDPVHAIVFETNGKRVLNYRVGVARAVQYIEGCA
jgi:hypothetical protein